jgi:enoyl-CoA hydratase/carnithine racemase
MNILKRTFCTAVSSSEAILTKSLGKSQNIMGWYLNTPKNRNALSKSLIENLKRNIDLVNTSDTIRAVILMSNAPGYFCAGADLKERQSMSELETEQFVMTLRKTFQQIDELKVPSICLLDGFALGGGLELAMACDIRVVTKTSVLGLTECSLGIIPGAGGTQRLPRLVGISKAKEMIYTAEKLNAERALNLGLVNHVVEKYEDLQEKGIEIAEKIVKNAPLSVVNAKRAINHGYGYDMKTGLDIEALCYAQILRTEDRVEGLKAFLEKRTPQFKGK